MKAAKNKSEDQESQRKRKRKRQRRRRSCHQRAGLGFCPSLIQARKLPHLHCCPLCPVSQPKPPVRRCAPVLRLSGQHTSSLPRGIMLMAGLPSLSNSLSLPGPSPLSGSTCLRALLLVLTEYPLIVGISPACLAKLGEGDLRLL